MLWAAVCGGMAFVDGAACRHPAGDISLLTDKKAIQQAAQGRDGGGNSDTPAAAGSRESRRPRRRACGL